MPSPLDDFLAAVRKACLPGLWSQGVKLAREGAVFGLEERGGSLVMRVNAPGLAVAPTVTLYPEDEEWTCDCGGKIDPCAHVAGAAIAVTQGSAAAQRAAAESGAMAPPSAPRSAPRGASAERALSSGETRAPSSSGAAYAPSNAAGTARSTSMAAAIAAIPRKVPRLRYVLARRGGALRLERWVAYPEGPQEPYLGSFTRPGPRGTQGPTLYPNHEDITIDRLVAGRQFGYLPIDRIPEVFGALASAPDVRFENRPVKVSTELVFPRAEVVDQPSGGVALVIDRDPRVTETLTGDIVLCGDTIHRLGELEIAGGRWDRLPIRRPFAKADFGTLVTKILPELRKRIPVDIKSRRLPQSHKGARPRILFRLDQREHTLSVVPELVYGDLPTARVENGKLVHLSGTVPVRDEIAERELVSRLRDELNLVTGRAVNFDGAEAIRFAVKLQAWSEKEGNDEPHALFGKRALVPRVRIDDRHFDIDFVLASSSDEGTEAGQSDDARDHAREGERADPAAVLRAWQDGLPLVPLIGGGFAPLPRDWLDRYGERVADLLAARRDDGTIATASMPAMVEFCDALEIPRPPSFDRLAPLFASFDALPRAPLPADLTATLRPYQQQGVDWLCFLRDASLGAVLADDMGLGKTLQALAAVRGRTLVVCPRSVVHNWAEEIRRFRPGLSCSIYHGPRRALDPKADITLTTYAIMRLDAELLSEVTWDTLVLDEAQAIKNQGSQVSRAAYALKADFRLSLSGTPVENRLEELWSQMHFTNRGLLGGYSDFQERYARPVSSGESQAAARLRQKIKPFVLRRLKREVAPELPPRSEAVLYCELEDQERSVYEAVLGATRKEVVAKLSEGGGVMAALEALLRLRQAACHPALVPGQQAESSSKIERLVEALVDAAADGHKALVFSQWTSLLDLVEPHLQRAEIAYTRLDGSTRDRGRVVASFQDASGPPVMLISLKAGGTGLNLTAADHVFLLDPWWNPAVEDQAADRAHRIGQDKPVMVYRLVAKDTVEEGILALQQKKRQIADAALGEADAAVGLTREDLLSLLS